MRSGSSISRLTSAPPWLTWSTGDESDDNDSDNDDDHLQDHPGRGQAQEAKDPAAPPRRDRTVIRPQKPQVSLVLFSISKEQIVSTVHLICLS